jgi:hypothetical protein
MNQWDRVVAAVMTAAGIAFVVLGWSGASRSSLLAEQIPYLASGAVGGLFALGAAATFWLSADLRDEWRKLDDIFTWLQSQGDAPRPAWPPIEPGGDPRPVRSGLDVQMVAHHAKALTPSEQP